MSRLLGCNPGVCSFVFRNSQKIIQRCDGRYGPQLKEMAKYLKNAPGRCGGGGRNENYISFYCHVIYKLEKVLNFSSLKRSYHLYEP